MVESLAIVLSGADVTKKALDALYFLRRFLHRPRHVASIWPSSRYLTQRMFAGLDLRSGDVLLEYGPGTGAFTVEVERLRDQGVELRYLGVEKDPGMYSFLVRRFPHLDFELGDAADIVEICRRRNLPRASAVISGLPLILLERATLEAIFAGTGQCLLPDGEFRTFSYLHSFPTPKAAELRDLMDLCFADYHLGAPVLRNLPPALVLTGRAPSTLQREVDMELALAPVPERLSGS